MIDENDYSHKIKKGTSLAWTEEEIVRQYREAKDQRAMIGILADLNNVSVSRIKAILRAAGVVLPKAQPKAKRKKEYSPPAVFFALEHDGRRYSIDDLTRSTGRSRTYIRSRIEGVDVATISGVEYKIIKYTKRRAL